MKRAFFSFDFDEDQTLKTYMVGQMKLPTSPFNGADWSMKEAAPQRNWESRRLKAGLPAATSWWCSWAPTPTRPLACLRK